MQQSKCKKQVPGFFCIYHGIFAVANIDEFNLIAEFLYMQFTKTNLMKNKRVKKLYTAFTNELIRCIVFKETAPKSVGGVREL